MHKYVAIALLFLGSTTVFAQSQTQDHAPFVAQCQADGRLWHSQYQEDHKLLSMSFKQLFDRTDEMIKCNAVDTSNVVDYIAISDDLLRVQHLRVALFMARHNLYPQFIAEDERVENRKGAQ